jgi:membrane associated rhomboid family serine protease
MNDAAVGFQCPSCVAEGRKSTRSGRTAYGGLRSSNPALTSMVLIGINIVVWLLVVLIPSNLVYRLSLLVTGVCASRGAPGETYDLFSEASCRFSNTNPAGDGQWIEGVSQGAYWQLMTSVFTHEQVWHIGFNMLALWFLGPQLEMAVGRSRFLALYLISGLAGSTLVYWAAGEFSGALGASGAIFGLMGALLVLAVKVRGSVQEILVWIGVNIVFTFTFPGISWQGHLGGFLGGLLIAAILVYSPRQHRTMWQSAGLVLLTLGLVAAILARTATLT